MNEQSNVSLSRHVFTLGEGLAVALFGAVVVTASGCPGPTPQAGTGAGGGGTSGSTTTSSTSTTTSSTSTTTSSTSTTTSAGCTTASDCPAYSTPCKAAECKGGACGFTPTVAGTSCGTSGEKYCDGAGHCLACLEPGHCDPSPTACQEPTCSSGTCGYASTLVGTSCSDSGGKVCDGGGKCLACLDPSHCDPPPTACLTATCSSGACGTTPTAAALPCSDGGGKVCDGAGHCVPCLTTAQCPVSKTNCVVPTCNQTTHACGTEFAAAESTCNDGGGRVCDGGGHCVACVSNADCPYQPCAGNSFTPPPTCTNHACVTASAQDCSATQQVCKLGGCSSCANDTECALPANEPCKVPTCTGGLCGSNNVPQGSPCPAPNGLDGTCDASGTCISGRYVFVTSQSYTASLGGVAGADQKCQDLAVAAGLGGVWMAWISDSVTSPSLRFPHRTVPYLLLNGAVVANDWTDLTDGALAHPIDTSEVPGYAVQGEVWTGTNGDGTPSGVACGNWMVWPSGTNGTQGLTSANTSTTPGGWTNTKAVACTNTMGRLYCFQQ